MSDDEPLFAAFDEDKRNKLHARGWRQVGGQRNGKTFWRHPKHGALMEEHEAFGWLDREEAEEARKAGLSPPEARRVQEEEGAG